MTPSTAAEERGRREKFVKSINELMFPKRNIKKKGLKLKRCKGVGRINVVRSSSGTHLEMSDPRWGRSFAQPQRIHSLNAESTAPASSLRKVFPLTQGLRGQIWVRIGLWYIWQVGVCELGTPSKKKGTYLQIQSRYQRMSDHHAVMRPHNIFVSC